MNTTARRLLGASALALVALTSGCGGSSDKAGGENPGEPLTLTYATNSADFGATRYAEAVDELSGGSMRIEIREAWRDGEAAFERGIVEDIAAGTAQMGDVGVRAFDTMGVTSFQALVAPLLIESVPLQQAVLTGEIPAPMLDGLDELGVVGLGVVPGALRRPAAKEALVTANDYRGRRIGVREGAVAEMALQALGATPVLYVPGDLSELDGAELDLTLVEGWGDDEGLRSVTANVVLWPKPMAIVIDEDVFETLTTEQQETLRKAATAAIEPIADDTSKRDAEDALELCGLDRSFLRSASSDDLESLRAAFEPVYRKLEEDPITRQAISEIRALRETIDAPLSPTCSRSPGTTTSDVATEALGTWEVSYTQEELRELGLSEEEVPEVAGTWTAEITDGRWVSRNQSSSLTFEATWAVSDGVWIDTIVGCTPASACKPGATYEYEVTVYKDTMTAKAIPGRPYDALSVLKPYRRVR